MTDLCSLDVSGLLSVKAALAQIKNSLVPVQGCEKVALKNALGRVLSEPVFSTINIPFDRNSAMDGYAFAAEGINFEQPFQLTLVGTSWAGKPFTGQLNPEECIRIFTGAVLPECADSVIMQEQASLIENIVMFPAHCRPYQNVRQAGEDVKQGEMLLAGGKKLKVADLGLLAAAGVKEVQVHRKIKVAYFSTGDELVSLEQPLKSGQIYDSNRYILHGLLTDPCFSVTDKGVIADDKQALEQAFVTTAAQADLLITSGGASVGEADYMQAVLTRCGTVEFWKLAIKPGKPLAFGHIGLCAFFALPGNPIAVITTFDQFVKPALQQLSGEAPKKPLQLKAVCQSRLKKSPGRQEYQRGILIQHSPGEFSVESAGRQGSHILSTMSKANCYIVLAPECAGVQAGEEVIVEPFTDFI